MSADPGCSFLLLCCAGILVGGVFIESCCTAHGPAKPLCHPSPSLSPTEPVPISALINANGQGNCTAGSRHCKYTVLPAAPGTCTNPKTKVRPSPCLVWCQLDTTKMHHPSISAFMQNIMQKRLAWPRLRGTRLKPALLAWRAVCPTCALLLPSLLPPQARCISTWCSSAYTHIHYLPTHTCTSLFALQIRFINTAGFAEFIAT